MCCFFIFQIICYAIFYAVNLTCYFVAKESKVFECLRYAEQNGNKYLIILYYLFGSVKCLSYFLIFLLFIYVLYFMVGKNLELQDPESFKRIKCKF